MSHLRGRQYQVVLVLAFLELFAHYSSYNLLDLELREPPFGRELFWQSNQWGIQVEQKRIHPASKLLKQQGRLSAPSFPQLIPTQ